MKKILVLGGSGFVGRSVCEHLVRRRADTRIVVPTRRLRHGRDLLPLPTVVLHRADVHDDAQLNHLVAGCDAVIHLVAILHGSQEAFDRVHVQLPRKLAAACQAAGVRRLVHVSALGVGDDPPSNYLRSKTAGEAALREAGGLDLTRAAPVGDLRRRRPLPEPVRDHAVGVARGAAGRRPCPVPAGVGRGPGRRHRGRARSPGQHRPDL